MAGNQSRVEKALYDALVALLKRKSIDKITVTELCGTADVNRATFYKRYYSLEEYYLHITEEKFREIGDMSAQIIAEKGPTNEAIKEVILYSFHSLIEEKALTPVFLRVDRAALKSHDASLHGLLPDDEQFRFEYSLIMMGMTGITNDWIAGGCKQSPDCIADMLTIMLKKLF